MREKESGRSYGEQIKNMLQDADESMDYDISTAELQRLFVLVCASEGSCGLRDLSSKTYKESRVQPL